MERQGEEAEQGSCPDYWHSINITFAFNCKRLYCRWKYSYRFWFEGNVHTDSGGKVSCIYHNILSDNYIHTYTCTYIYIYK